MVQMTAFGYILIDYTIILVIVAHPACILTIIPSVILVKSIIMLYDELCLSFFEKQLGKNYLVAVF